MLKTRGYNNNIRNAGACINITLFKKEGFFMSGLPLIIVFILAIIVMIVAISKFKVHPFLAIMGVSLILAILESIINIISYGHNIIIVSK